MSKPNKGCFLTLLPGSLLLSAHLELITPGHGADPFSCDSYNGSQQRTEILPETLSTGCVIAIKNVVAMDATKHLPMYGEAPSTKDYLAPASVMLRLTVTTLAPSYFQSAEFESLEGRIRGPKMKEPPRV